jgi:hypothetical protein
MLFDAADVLVGSTATLADGSYSFENLPWDRYTIEVDPGTLPAGLAPTNDPDGISTANQAELLLGCVEDNAAENFGFGPTLEVPSMRGVGLVLLAMSLTGSMSLVLSRRQRA